jgi:hypothetical protein
MNRLRNKAIPIIIVITIIITIIIIIIIIIIITCLNYFLPGKETTSFLCISLTEVKSSPLLPSSSKVSGLPRMQSMSSALPVNMQTRPTNHVNLDSKMRLSTNSCP